MKTKLNRFTLGFLAGTIVTSIIYSVVKVIRSDNRLYITENDMWDGEDEDNDYNDLGGMIKHAD